MSVKYELGSITKRLISKMDLAELLLAKSTFKDIKYESVYYDAICAELKKRRDAYESHT